MLCRAPHTASHEQFVPHFQSTHGAFNFRCRHTMKVGKYELRSVFPQDANQNRASIKFEVQEIACLADSGDTESCGAVAQKIKNLTGAHVTPHATHRTPHRFSAIRGFVETLQAPSGCSGLTKAHLLFSKPFTTVTAECKKILLSVVSGDCTSTL